MIRDRTAPREHVAELGYERLSVFSLSVKLVRAWVHYCDYDVRDWEFVVILFWTDGAEAKDRERRRKGAEI